MRCLLRSTTTTVEMLCPAVPRLYPGSLMGSAFWLETKTISLPRFYPGAFCCGMRSCIRKHLFAFIYLTFTIHRGISNRWFCRLKFTTFERQLHKHGFRKLSRKGTSSNSSLCIWQVMPSGHLTCKCIPFLWLFVVRCSCVQVLTKVVSPQSVWHWHSFVLVDTPPMF